MMCTEKCIFYLPNCITQHVAEEWIVLIKGNNIFIFSVTGDKNHAET